MTDSDAHPEVLPWYPDGTRRADLLAAVARNPAPDDRRRSAPITIAHDHATHAGPLRRVARPVELVGKGIARRGLRMLDRYEFVLDDVGTGGARSAVHGIVRRTPRMRRPASKRSAPSAAGDLAAFCPIGFRQASDATDIVVTKLDLTGSRHAVDRSIRRAKRARSVSIAPIDTMSPDERRNVCRLAATGAVLVTPTASEPPDLPTADLPIADDLATIEDLAPAEDLATIVARATIVEIREPRARELHSIVRRAARRELALDGQQAARRFAPSVSVLMASNRPDDLEQALGGIARQSVRDIEVVIGLHGSGWTAAHRADIDERLGDRAVVASFDESLNLGEVLNELAARAGGDIVTKWDDDDWYGPHHIEDLVAALDYSGADLVGKAAEFVRLEHFDLTIRRFAIGAETYTSTLAGGTLTLRRDTLASVGGWSPTPRNVDANLIAAVRAADGSTYRTHGFEYLLRRRLGDHTWVAGEGYFLRAAADFRAGLDLPFAGIDD